MKQKMSRTLTAYLRTVMRGLILCTYAALPVCAQNIIHVPADQPTVQAGINAARNGDTVLVSPGIYKELIDFEGEAIIVTSGATSSSDPLTLATILNGGATNGPVVSFKHDESASALLNGFTVQNGISNIAPIAASAGVYIDHASPTVSNNLIWKNTGCGVLIVNQASPLILANNINHNQGVDMLEGSCASTDGGGTLGTGIAVYSAGDVSIVGNSITNNYPTPGKEFLQGYGIYFHNFKSVRIERNYFAYTDTDQAENIFLGPVYNTDHQGPTTMIGNVFDGHIVGTGLNFAGSYDPPYPTFYYLSNTVYGGGGYGLGVGPSSSTNNIYAQGFGCTPLTPSMLSLVSVSYLLIYNGSSPIQPTGCLFGPSVIEADRSLSARPQATFICCLPHRRSTRATRPRRICPRSTSTERTVSSVARSILVPMSIIRSRRSLSAPTCPPQSAEPPSPLPRS